MRWISRVCAALVMAGVSLTAFSGSAGAPVRYVTPFVLPFAATPSPTGNSPAQIEQVYGWSATGGAGTTIAVVDAFSTPTILPDLAHFDATFGLPAATLTIAQPEGSPPVTTGWTLETSLDVEWAHAIAPQAKVLLVEASTPSYGAMFTAVAYASHRAQYVSMSWGGTDTTGQTFFDSTFVKGVSYFAASGDTGAVVKYPSASPDVVSVGGTTLTPTGTTPWTRSGGGCSTVEPATSAQMAHETVCGTMRATPDISLDANPQTGVSIFDTTMGGWWRVGGTSVATPLAAAHAASLGVAVNSTVVYGGDLKVFDITSGITGRLDGAHATCAPGYDLCSGLGAWNTRLGTSTGTPPPVPPPPPATPPKPPPPTPPPTQPPGGLGIHVSNIVGMAVLPAGGGYWLVGRDGGVFSFGAAQFYGSLPGLGVHVTDVVGIDAAPTGHGYWLVGADGGVFAFGSAKYLGSLP